MKTIVYIDGFNLYYGSVKDTPYRWLDLSALCARLLPFPHSSADPLGLLCHLKSDPKQIGAFCEPHVMRRRTGRRHLV